MENAHAPAHSTHTVLPGSRHYMMPGSRLMDQCNPDEIVKLTLKLRRKNPLPPLEGRPAVPISRSEAAAQYGATDDDIAKVKEVMEANKITVLSADQATRSVQVEGPIKVLEDVFQVKLFEFTHTRGNFRGRTGMVHIPSALDGVVTAVYGLDNRPVIRRNPKVPTEPAPAARVASGDAPAGFAPAQLAEVYDFPPGDGTGEVIGILEFGGGFFPDDLQLFCDTVGVSVPTVTPVSVDNTPTDTMDEAAGEVMLDVEVVAGACPGATQVVYFGSPQFDEKAWVDTLGAAIHDQDNAPFILSISYGLSEDSNAWQEGTIPHVNDTLQEAAMMGITICISSGDDGSADETDDGTSPNEIDGLAHADFPSSSPFVLSVGGTDLRLSPGGKTENVWKDGNGRRFFQPAGTGTGGSTGGGVSTKFPHPASRATSRSAR